MVKQVIVYRRDLNMRKGKIAAQVAHASMKVFFDRAQRDALGWMAPTSGTGADDNSPVAVFAKPLLVIPLDEEEAEWVFGTFAKVVLAVDSEEDLLRAYELAKERDLPTALITDLGHTEFHGVPTNTAVAIGPASAEVIDEITGPEGIIKTRLA